MLTVKLLKRTQAVRFNFNGSVEHVSLEKDQLVRVHDHLVTPALPVWVATDGWLFPKHNTYLMEDE